MCDEEVLKRIIKEDDGIDATDLKMSIYHDYVFYGYQFERGGKFKQKIKLSYFKQKKREYKLEKIL